MSVETYDYVEHTAIVQSTDPVRNIVNVRITDLEECGDCPAAQLCNAAGSESNIIAIITPSRLRIPERRHPRDTRHRTDAPQGDNVCHRPAMYRPCSRDGGGISPDTQPAGSSPERHRSDDPLLLHPLVLTQ